MTASDLHSALLRPAVLQVLKASGFSLAKPAVVDSLADLAAKYLLLVASESAEFALSNHGDNQPTVQDVRLALEKVGALRPQMKATEEFAKGTEMVDGVLVPFEDLRGVRSFVKWAEGPIHKEIRRVGGLDGGDTDNVADLAAGMEENEDYVTAIKKKHSKTAEESRFQGTTLGKDGDLHPISIAGGSLDSLAAWTAHKLGAADAQRKASRSTSAISSALSTPIDAATPDEG